MKKEFSPCCGKVEISREVPPLDAGNLGAGGWSKRCEVCGSLLWIPIDENNPVELIVIPVHGSPGFEPEEIFFNSEKKLLQAAAKGEIDAE